MFVFKDGVISNQNSKFVRTLLFPFQNSTIITPRFCDRASQKKFQISIVSKLVSTIDSNSASCMSGLQGGAAKKRKTSERNEASNDGDNNVSSSRKKHKKSPRKPRTSRKQYEHSTILELIRLASFKFAFLFRGGVVSSVHTDRWFFDKMIEMLIECLLECDRQLPKEYADLRDEFLGPRSTLLDTNNRSTKVREMHKDLRSWIHKCLCESPNSEIMDLEAWGAIQGVVLLPPRVEPGGVVFHHFPLHANDNNLISAHLRRFLSWGFIFFDPAKHKIKVDGEIVPEADMIPENAFGPLFMDFLWNGLFKQTLNLHRLLEYFLSVDTQKFISMCYLQKYSKFIDDPAKPSEEAEVCYVFSADILATFLWLCEVAVEEVRTESGTVRTDSGTRREQLFDMFNECPAGDPEKQNLYEEQFQKKFRESVEFNKRRWKRVVVEHQTAATKKKRFRPALLSPPRVSARASTRVRCWFFCAFACA